MAKYSPFGSEISYQFDTMHISRLIGRDYHAIAQFRFEMHLMHTLLIRSRGRRGTHVMFKRCT